MYSQTAPCDKVRCVLLFRSGSSEISHVASRREASQPISIYTYVFIYIYIHIQVFYYIHIYISLSLYI